MMVFQSCELKGRCLKDLNTEIRYTVASSRADGVELICFVSTRNGDEREHEKILYCISRILGSMKREGHIQFIAKSLVDGSREAEYINNKYAENLNNTCSDAIYAKL